MKVKELIEKLKNIDEEKEVLVRFGLDEDEDIGYVLETFTTGEYGGEFAIYAEYTATKKDCDFFGIIDLKEAYQKMKKKCVKKYFKEKIENQKEK